MKARIRSFGVVSWFVLIVAALAWPSATVEAGGSDDKPFTVAAAQSSKQKNACRARYRDCIRLKQIPPFECQSVYWDCINHIY